MAYNYGSGTTSTGGNIRGQNIGVAEGALNRTHTEQLAAQQDELARAQMAQQYKMFEEDQAMKDRLAQEAAEQAKQDRLYGMIGGGVGGILGAGGSVLGGWLGK